MHIMVYVHSLTGESGAGLFRSSALDGAIQVAKEIPDTRITAVAMDRPNGDEVLRSSLALAADAALLLQGPEFAVYDSVTLACLLAGAVQAAEREQGPVDAVFCGDSDPGQDGLGGLAPGDRRRPGRGNREQPYGLEELG